MGHRVEYISDPSQVWDEGAGVCSTGYSNIVNKGLAISRGKKSVALLVALCHVQPCSKARKKTSGRESSVIVVGSFVGVEVKPDFEGQESKYTRVRIFFGIVRSFNMSIHYPLFVQTFR